MGTRVLLTALLSAAWLNGCAEDRSDPPNVEALARACEAIATTGDMYRYCMKVGPEKTLPAESALLARQ
jgi:hypothetical protein